MAISRFSTSSVAQGLPKYQKLWDGTSVVFDSDYELIERVTVGSSGASTITFSSIPSTYRHLQVRGVMYSSSANNDILMRFNSDSGTNYSSHTTYGNGTSAAVINAGSISYVALGFTGDATTGGAFVGDIVDYANTNKHKGVKSIAGRDANGGGYIVFEGGNWRNTAAINTVTITHGLGVNFNQHSQFAIYGIKGA